MPEVNGVVPESGPKENKMNAKEIADKEESQSNGGSETPSTTSPVEESPLKNEVKESPLKNEGEILLAQGKRHLLIKDYTNAVSVLADACEKLSEIFGDGADECADAYFNYGRALLELAREETGVIRTEPEKEDSEEGDDEDDEEDDESKPKDTTESKEIVAETADEDEEKSEVDEMKGKDSPADETIDTTKEINQEETEEGDGKEEDLDNLQLSWEVFEVAKNIYARQKADAKLAETYFYLGEVQLESENYNGALDDLKKCVDVQKQILPPDHRDIAETYFQLGVACSLCNDFDLAIENFKASSDILENRVKNLQENGPPTSETEKNPFYSVEKEITEIKALLPEISAKIADMEDFKQETIKRLRATLGELPKSSDGAGPSSSSSSVPPVANGSTPKPATNISHLVRKKRKPDEEAVSELSVKKTCTEEAKSNK